MLSILGFLTDNRLAPKDEPVTVRHQVLARRVTYAKWLRPGDANPIQFDAMDAKLVETMRLAGAVYMLRLIPSCFSFLI